MNTKIFKAYDIRGIYPDELDQKTAYSIGRAVVLHLQAKNIAVGRDARPSSPLLFAELSRGITEAGGNVLDLGQATTPLVYYASHQENVDASISLTASHNPPNWNGMKITSKDAVPIGGDSGLKEIEAIALMEEATIAPITGKVISFDLLETYQKHLGSFWKLGNKKFKVVIDAANAMGVLELPIYDLVGNNISVSKLYCNLDQAFDCHEANPLKTETLEELCKKVKEDQADLGIAYDGDADRVGFVDETGEIVPMDLVTAILSAPILEKYPESTILYDLRSSLRVKEEIEKNGGKAIECKVGHANIKKQMRDENAIFAGELSGHYYFKENSYAESSTLAAIFLMNRMAETGKKLSELVGEIKKYFHTGEINSTVSNPRSTIKKLKEYYKDGAQSELDGIKISYPDWWFNVRSSNTEPLLRLNLEAKTKEIMEEKRKEVLKIINN